MLQVRDLSKRFVLRRSAAEWARRRPGDAHLAVNNVSFDLARGEILGLAGGSGSGKTTLARMLVRLVEPDGGEVVLEGREVRALRGGDLREIRRRMQMVFQDPYSSLNPRLSVGSAILEAGRVHHQPGSENGDQFVTHLLDLVRLPAATASRHPRELSGGQRQRVAVARALAVGPEILIADEAVSALDVSIQTQLLNLFLDLRDELGLAVLFVAHQLSVIAEVADRVAIMHHGEIVEIGPTGDVFHSPQAPYTQTLLGAHPRPVALLDRPSEGGSRAGTP
ncbi:MAG: ATP-binding cassette domain-containing protein [Acidimicrobiales bacterium]